MVSVDRPYIQDSNPSANMFLARSDSFFPIPRSSVARTVMEVIGTLKTWKPSSVPSDTGSLENPAFSTLRGVKASSFTMTVPPLTTLSRSALSAAGFMATRTSAWSPGVVTSIDANWIWKAETPWTVPAGARISAGKSGRVARSLPSTAVALVKRSPVNCMPSPESPANRMTTRSFSWTVLGISGPCGVAPWRMDCSVHLA